MERKLRTSSVTRECDKAINPYIATNTLRYNLPKTKLRSSSVCEGKVKTNYNVSKKALPTNDTKPSTIEAKQRSSSSHKATKPGLPSFSSLLPVSLNLSLDFNTKRVIKKRVENDQLRSLSPSTQKIKIVQVQPPVKMSLPDETVILGKIATTTTRRYKFHRPPKGLFIPATKPLISRKKVASRKGTFGVNSGKLWLKDMEKPPLWWLENSDDSPPSGKRESPCSPQEPYALTAILSPASNFSSNSDVITPSPDCLKYLSTCKTKSPSITSIARVTAAFGRKKHDKSNDREKKPNPRRKKTEVEEKTEEPIQNESEKKPFVGTSSSWMRWRRVNVLGGKIASPQTSQNNSASPHTNNDLPRPATVPMSHPDESKVKLLHSNSYRARQNTPTSYVKASVTDSQRKTNYLQNSEVSRSPNQTEMYHRIRNQAWSQFTTNERKHYESYIAPPTPIRKSVPTTSGRSKVDNILIKKTLADKITVDKTDDSCPESTSPAGVSPESTSPVEESISPDDIDQERLDPQIEGSYPARRYLARMNPTKRCPPKKSPFAVFSAGRNPVARRPTHRRYAQSSRLNRSEDGYSPPDRQSSRGRVPFYRSLSPLDRNPPDRGCLDRNMVDKSLVIKNDSQTAIFEESLIHAAPIENLADWSAVRNSYKRRTGVRKSPRKAAERTVRKVNGWASFRLGNLLADRLADKLTERFKLPVLDDLLKLPERDDCGPYKHLLRRPSYYAKLSVRSASKFKSKSKMKTKRTRKPPPHLKQHVTEELLDHVDKSARCNTVNQPSERPVTQPYVSHSRRPSNRPASQPSRSRSPNFCNNEGKSTAENAKENDPTHLSKPMLTIPLSSLASSHNVQEQICPPFPPNNTAERLRLPLVYLAESEDKENVLNKDSSASRHGSLSVGVSRRPLFTGHTLFSRNSVRGVLRRASDTVRQYSSNSTQISLLTPNRPITANNAKMASTFERHNVSSQSNRIEYCGYCGRRKNMCLCISSQ